MQQDRRLIAARRSYAEELKYVAHIGSDAIVRAFAKVPREAFLGPGPWRIASGKDWTTADDDPKHLYHNILVAIDPARGLNNGQPGFLAYLIDALELKAGEHVAHIGCGTGYYSAILAEVVGKNGRVTAVEIDRKLAARAKRNLSPWPHVSVLAADGSRCGLDLVDALLINAGATHPAAVWLDALAPGGRMVLPLTIENGGGSVLKVARLAGGYAARFIGAVGMFPCAGARSKRANRQLEAAFDAGKQNAVRSLRRDPHELGRTCWLHGTDFCLSRTAVPDGTSQGVTEPNAKGSSKKISFDRSRNQKAPHRLIAFATTASFATKAAIPSGLPPPRPVASRRFSC